MYDKHFDELSPAEQEALLAIIHPSVLENGMWVSPGAPREDELAFWCNLPGADNFRREIIRLGAQIASELVEPQAEEHEVKDRLAAAEFLNKARRRAKESAA